MKNKRTIAQEQHDTQSGQFQWHDWGESSIEVEMIHYGHSSEQKVIVTVRTEKDCNAREREGWGRTVFTGTIQELADLINEAKAIREAYSNAR